MKLIKLFCVALALLVAVPAMAQERQDVNIRVQRIWSNGEYCSFTSLVKFKGKYYVSFRESDSHQILNKKNRNGKARVIVSEDGEHWRSVVLLGKDGYDIRDPKLSITPDGRLMMNAGGSIYKDLKFAGMVPQVSFSADGEHFSDFEPMQLPAEITKGSEYVWHIEWHDGVGYGVSYGSGLALVKTTDGLHYDLVTKLDMPGFPNEATVRVNSKGTMAMILRREEGQRHGAWGVSEPPYTSWNWKEMDVPLGGPDFIFTTDSTTIVASRSLYSTEKTMLFNGNMRGKVEEVCILPSGGDDNSYTSMMQVGDDMWVTYYSKHEGEKASIYLAKIPMSVFSKGITSQYFYKEKLTSL